MLMPSSPFPSTAGPSPLNVATAAACASTPATGAAVTRCPEKRQSSSQMAAAARPGPSRPFMSTAMRRARLRIASSAKASCTRAGQFTVPASFWLTSRADPKATHRCTLKRCSSCRGIPMKGHP